MIRKIDEISELNASQFGLATDESDPRAYLEEINATLNGFSLLETDAAIRAYRDFNVKRFKKMHDDLERIVTLGWEDDDVDTEKILEDAHKCYERFHKIFNT